MHVVPCLPHSLALGAETTAHLQFESVILLSTRVRTSPPNNDATIGVAEQVNPEYAQYPSVPRL